MQPTQLADSLAVEKGCLTIARCRLPTSATVCFGRRQSVSALRLELTQGRRYVSGTIFPELA
jgi:hypothetical protein